MLIFFFNYFFLLFLSVFADKRDCFSKTTTSFTKVGSEQKNIHRKNYGRTRYGLLRSSGRQVSIFVISNFNWWFGLAIKYLCEWNKLRCLEYSRFEDYANFVMIKNIQMPKEDRWFLPSSDPMKWSKFMVLCSNFFRYPWHSHLRKFPFCKTSTIKLICVTKFANFAACRVVISSWTSIFCALLNQRIISAERKNSLMHENFSWQNETCFIQKI